MADFTKIFEQAQQMQARMQQMQSELEKQTVTAAAGGGMVTVEADGKGTITRVKIDPSVADPKDLEMLEDLVLVAVNEAQKKAAELAKGEMGKLTGGSQSSVQASVLAWELSTIWPRSYPNCPALGGRRRSALPTIS